MTAEKERIEMIMMSEKQKKRITAMRLKGYSYNKIADELSICSSTVRMFCYRNGLRDCDDRSHCIICGTSIIQPRRGGRKIYCSERCRSAYRRLIGSIDQIIYSHVCEECGRPFETRGNRKQKYCSRECYHESRKVNKHERVLSECVDL